MVLLSKKGSIEHFTNKLLEEEVLDRSLHFDHCGRDLYHTEDWKACMIHFSSYDFRSEAETDHRQFTVSERGAMAVHGMVTEQVTEPADLPVLDARAFMKIMETTRGAAIRRKYMGEYSYAFLDAGGRLRASCDVMGFQHLYYAEDENLLIVSNRIRCIRNILENPELSLPNLSLLVVWGCLLEGRTTVKQVKRLEGGSDLFYDGRMLHVETHPDWFSGSIPDNEYEKTVSDYTTACINRIRAVLKDSKEIRLPLTGGRDSRLYLAMLLMAGQKEKLHTVTNGFEAHPDVIISRLISEHYGIPHTVKPPAAPMELPDDEILKKVMSGVFQTDGCLGSYNSYDHLWMNKATAMQAHASAAFKPFAKKTIRIYEQAEDLRSFSFKNRYVRPEVREGLREKIRDIVDGYKMCGVSAWDTADSFLLRQRLPNFQGYVLEQLNYKINQIQLVNNENLFRLSYSNTQFRQVMRLHYEMYKKCDPWLVEAPFAEYGWKKELAKYVGDDLKLDTPALEIPKGIPSFGGWQYKIQKSRTFRNKLWDILSSYDSSPYWDYFDRSEAEKLIRDDEDKGRGMMPLWNFVGTFFYYHGLELPFRIGLVDHPPVSTVLETTEGRRGILLKKPYTLTEQGLPEQEPAQAGTSPNTASSQTTDPAAFFPNTVSEKDAGQAAFTPNAVSEKDAGQAAFTPDVVSMKASTLDAADSAALPDRTFLYLEDAFVRPDFWENDEKWHFRVGNAVIRYLDVNPGLSLHGEMPLSEYFPRIFRENFAVLPFIGKEYQTFDAALSDSLLRIVLDTRTERPEPVEESFFHAEIHRHIRKGKKHGMLVSVAQNQYFVPEDACLIAVYDRILSKVVDISLIRNGASYKTSARPLARRLYR